MPEKGLEKQWASRISHFSLRGPNGSILIPRQIFYASDPVRLLDAEVCQESSVLMYALRQRKMGNNFSTRGYENDVWQSFLWIANSCRVMRL